MENPISRELDVLLKLGFSNRYAALFAGAPTVPKNVDPEGNDIEGGDFAKRLLAMLKRENFVKSENEGLRMKRYTTLTIRQAWVD